MTIVSSKIIAGCFALCAFAVAIVAGLASGNSAAQILLRAILAMLVCYPVGFIAGLVCEYVVRSHIKWLDETASPTVDKSLTTETGEAVDEEEPIVV